MKWRACLQIGHAASIRDRLRRANGAIQASSLQRLPSAPGGRLSRLTSQPSGSSHSFYAPNTILNTALTPSPESGARGASGRPVPHLVGREIHGAVEPDLLAHLMPGESPRPSGGSTVNTSSGGGEQDAVGGHGARACFRKVRSAGSRSGLSRARFGSIAWARPS